MILVTGGAGFIGSHVVDLLLDAGEAVRVLDLKAPHRDDVDAVVGDVRDRGTVAEALCGVDAVCHQAARVGLERGVNDAPSYVEHNDRGTAVLLCELAAARFTGPLVLASSMVVYGEGRYACRHHGEVRPGPRRVADLEQGRFEPRCPECAAPVRPQAVPEDAPVDPRNVYAATKVHQEHLAFAYARQTGARVVALRYHNVYGPRMPRDTPYAGVAAIFADALLSGRPPRVHEDGRQLRDFVHVRDVARANVVALAACEVHGVINVCSGTPRTVGELAIALADGAGPRAPRPVTTGDYRLGDVRHVFADPQRARRWLGFEAQEDFRLTVADSTTDSLVAAPSLASRRLTAG
jgi:dTDP-L-rhamnose 4-epimerase